MGIGSLMHNLTTKDAVAAAPAVAGDRPTNSELYRNRYQFGVNFGALFVQEKWIDDSLFTDKSDGGSELAALEGSYKSGEKIEDMRKKWENHWQTFITPEDWQFLTHSGVTAIRLPIGYWNVDPKYCKHTDFEKFADVYQNSWKAIRSIIDEAGKHNIGVLVDFHGLPGGANGDEHSGSSTKKAELWHSSKYRDIAIEVYETAVKDLKSVENVVGIQLVNEAPYGEEKIKNFYLDAVSRIRKIDESIPIIISDGWDLDSWRKTIHTLDEDVSSNSVPASTGLVIDTHVYRTFSDEDKGKSADDHIHAAPSCVPEDDKSDVMVGEFSCCLSEESWSKTQGDRGQKEVEFGRAQMSCFLHGARAGAYFWTFKFGQGSGGSWDFRNMAHQGALPNPAVQGPAQNKDEALQRSLQAHKNYWESQDKKTDWEHWRFEDGFNQGWQDADYFAHFNGSRLGRVAAWTAARTAQHVKEKGKSDKVWVYSQAFDQAVHAYYHN